MKLIEKIETVLFQEGLNIKEFLEKTRFSKKLYYAIKNGEKTELTPSQKKTMTDVFPSVTFEWLSNDSHLVSEDPPKYQKENLTDSEKLDFIYNKLFAIEKKLDDNSCKLDLMKGLLALSQKIQDEEEKE